MKELIKKIEEIKDVKDFKEVRQLESEFIRVKRKRAVHATAELLKNSVKYLPTPSLLEVVQFVKKKDLYTYEEILKYELLKENHRVQDFIELYKHKVRYNEKEIYFIILEIIFNIEGIDITDDDQIIENYLKIEKKYKTRSIRKGIYETKEEMFLDLFNIDLKIKGLYNKENRTNKNYLNELIQLEEFDYNNLLNGFCKKVPAYEQLRKIEGVDDLYYYKVLNKKDYLKIDLKTYQNIIELNFLYRYKESIKTKTTGQKVNNKINKLLNEIKQVQEKNHNNKVLKEFIKVYNDKTLKEIKKDV